MSLSILSKEQAPQGSDYYRDEAIVVPNAFKPSLVHTVKANATGSNHNVTIRSDDNVVVTSDGKTTASDSFIMTTKFTALQSVIAAEERARIYDAHIVYLALSRKASLDGRLPDSPIVITPAFLTKYATFIAGL